LRSLANEQLLLSAPTAVRGWLIPFASRIVVIAPQQNCGRYAALVTMPRGKGVV
jgi:hypothetical protein